MKEHEFEASKRSGLDFCLEAKPIHRLRIVIHDILAGHAVPEIELVARVYQLGREDSFHVEFP
jgi:hypothetical protein